MSVLDYGSLLIAVCALFLTIFEIRQQRRHNALSIRPHLASQMLQQFTGSEATLKVQISNNGLGPAFIKTFQAMLDGKVCSLGDAVSSAIGKIDGQRVITTLNPKYVMPSGAVSDVLILKFPCAASDELAEIVDKVNRVDICIEYECGYGIGAYYDSRE